MISDQKASEHIKNIQQQNKIYYDGINKLPTDYIQGDLVLMDNYGVTPGINKKWIPKFKGLYIYLFQILREQNCNARVLLLKTNQ